MIHTANNQGQAKCGAHGRYVFASSDQKIVNCKKCLGKVRRTAAWAPITGNYVGKIFHCSWGYSMTINEYVKVVRQTEKSLIVQECQREVKDDVGMGNGRAMTNGQLKPNAPQFSIKLRQRAGSNYQVWIGTMPDCGSANWWQEWDGQADYHNTWD